MAGKKQKQKKTPTRNGGGNGNKNGGSRRRNRNLPRNAVSMPRNPLLPTGVSNQATMPSAAQTYTVSAEEVVRIINVSPGSTVGQIVFNEQITPKSTIRLAGLSNLWQRIKWLKLHLRLVALNGSLVTSGYTMGFLEDPEIGVPAAPSEVIPFLTAMRSTTVRQNWVESTSGTILNVSELPEMYTQLGQDVRRYSPGRLVVAVAGDVTSNTTFQVMMSYTVCLKLPFVAPSINPIDAYEFTGPLLQGIADGGTTDAIPATSTSSFLPAGDWVLTNNNVRFLGANQGNGFVDLSLISTLYQIAVSGIRSTGLETSWEDYNYLLPNGITTIKPVSVVPDGSELVPGTIYWQSYQELSQTGSSISPTIFNRGDTLIKIA